MKRSMTTLLMFFFFSNGALAMGHGEFIAKCARLLAPEATSLRLRCTSNSPADTKKLKSIGVESSIAIDLGDSSRTEVGSMGQYLYQVAYQVKSGFFGLGSKYLLINCSEAADGSVRLTDKLVQIEIENRIDVKTYAQMTCK